MFRLAYQVSSRLAKNSTRPAYGSRLLSSIAAGTDMDCKESMFSGDGGTSGTMVPLDFHYEDVLRQDMLLKLNYTNIMEVPGLSDIRVVPKTASDLLTKNGKLAMEISCGQKFKETQKGPAVSNAYAGSFKDKRIVNDVAVQSTLRGHGMSNFLVRILTAMSLADSPVQIRDASVQFSMETEFCESSPELEDHFEIFEPIRGFNVTIATSAKTQDETSLLWSGILQKDEGETQ